MFGKPKENPKIGLWWRVLDHDTQEILVQHLIAGGPSRNPQQALQYAKDFNDIFRRGTNPGRNVEVSVWKRDPAEPGSIEILKEEYRTDESPAHIAERIKAIMRLSFNQHTVDVVSKYCPPDSLTCYSELCEQLKMFGTIRLPSYFGKMTPMWFTNTFGNLYGSPSQDMDQYGPFATLDSMWRKLKPETKQAIMKDVYEGAE